MVEITIVVTAAQATAFQEALAYWNEKHEQELTPIQMMKRLARQFYRDNAHAKLNDMHQADVDSELDGVWS